MKNIISISLLLIIFSCTTQTKKKESPLDEKFGFKNIKLESNIKELHDSLKLTKISEIEDISIYRIANQYYYSIGDTKLSDVKIKVLRDSIFSINLQEKNAVSFEFNPILNVLKAAYGNGKYSEDSYSKQQLWIGQKTLLSFEYPITSNGISNTKIVFTSKALSKRLIDLSKKKNKSQIKEL